MRFREFFRKKLLLRKPILADRSEKRGGECVLERGRMGELRLSGLIKKRISE